MNDDKPKSAVLLNATGKAGAKPSYITRRKRKTDEIDLTPVSERSVSNYELLKAGGWKTPTKEDRG